MKDIDGILVKAIHDLVNDTRDFKFFDSHKLGAVSPTIEELKRYDPELATLFMEATGIVNLRNSPDFRRKFRLQALPLLPDVSCDSDKFLSRWVNDKDLEHYNNFYTESFTVKNDFMSFYLNGLKVGGTGNSNCELICEVFYNVKHIGALSVVPGEDEVVMEEGGVFKIHGEFIGIKSLLNAKILANELTRLYYKRLINVIGFEDRRYIYISEVKT